MLFFMYFLNYLDRNAIALARLNDLEEDLNLTPVRKLSTRAQGAPKVSNKSLTGSRVSDLRVHPVCRLHPRRGTLQHVPHSHQTQSLHGIPRRCTQPTTTDPLPQAIMMVIWATVSAVTALSKDFTGLLLTRFFLGATEAPFYPGAVYIISSFYTRKEIATRIAILYTGNIASTAFAGLIAAGVFYGMDDLAGIAGWKWLFILQGLVTALVGVAGWFLLPDYPLDTWWLSQEERQLAYNRVELDITGNNGEVSVWSGLRQALSDPMVWLFALMAHLHLASNGFKNFVSQSGVSW